MSSDLQNKMFHFEADPPKEVWGRIADALDADAADFPQRLFTYEETPAADNWQKIEAALEESEEPVIKVIPITQYKKPLRYLAAAASIIAVVFIVFSIANKKTGAGSVISGTETVNSANQSSILPLDKPTVVNDSPQTQDLSSIDNPVSEEENTNPVKRKILAAIRPQNIYPAVSFSQAFVPKKADKEVLLDFSELDSYMVYNDGKGTAMRLPKKLFGLVNCADGDLSCKERIQQLQQKMAATATTTDFGGILEILRQLQ